MRLFYSLRLPAATAQLIVPNPESSLNDEAGKMLLERYEDYCTRARSWTKIHATGKKDREAVEAARPTAAADAEGQVVLDKENSKSNDGDASTARAPNTSTDAPIAKKPKAAAKADKKKKINRRL